MILALSDDLKPIAAEVLAKVGARIAAALPDVEVHHIGATAIAGALTKGDLDVVLRVGSQDFAAATEKLRAVFDVKQPENWTPYFASFGSDSDFALSVGVQLVIENSEADFFLFARDYLASHPEALAAYNQLKRNFSGLGPEAYWAAKERFFAEIIARMPEPRR